LEDWFVATNPEAKAKALALAGQYPQVLIAGSRTFTPESISKTLSAHGDDRGVDLERRRLEMYRIVAAVSDYESAKSNVDSAAVGVDRRREEQRRLSEEQRIEEQRIANERRKNDEEARAEMERKRLQRRVAVMEAANKSRLFCQSHAECQKAFSLTQIFVSENSDMKIQVATETIIETYNPTDSMKTGLKAVKIPRRADSAEIVVTASCRDEGRESFKDICDEKLLSIYRAFPIFIHSALRP